MTKAKQIKFKKSDKNGNILTECYYNNNPETILAIMVENLNKDFEEPLYLQKSVLVSIQKNDLGERMDISIWFSVDVNNDSMSSIIQSFFDWKFPDLKSKNPSMTFDENGKLAINYKI